MRPVRTALLTALTLLLAGTPAQASGGETCEPVRVPGAEHQVSTCLADLTTAGTLLTGHTVQSDWAGLSSVRTVNPSGVPGIQVDGYFRDTSATNTHHGWNHDAQFVLRLPDRWNGKLIVTGAPGVRRQYALDATIADWVLAQGYAFAATDKGNTGAEFYRDGRRPGDAVAEWNHRVTELTVAAKAAVAQRYGRAPHRTYLAGISNGGYLVRWQLENRAHLYDGGVDAEGTLFRSAGPNLFTYLPSALRNYPTYKAGSEVAHQAMLDAGFAPGSEFLWDFHYQVYWDLTQRIYREEFDPSHDGATEAGTPFCASGTPACDADYDYSARPASVRNAVRRVELSGKISRPMLTLHGTLDTLLPPATNSDVYAELVRDRGRGSLHRYYVIEDANHVDGLYDAYPDRLRPLVPCLRDALTVLDHWVSAGHRPPPSHTVPRPTTGDPVNNCTLASTS
jgi:fermentation-respiration switch protein FrsA (DUF1100 family)